MSKSTDVVVEIHRIVLPAAGLIGYGYGLMGSRQRPMRVTIERFPAQVLGEKLAKAERPQPMRFDPDDVEPNAWRDRDFEPLPGSQVWEPKAVPA